ncbi:MAG: 23S rRNA (pseudouridine(1915)-N(3))-methyltransferase RlmH [Victivallaceae bacterium]|nr:23S rRNA (pseudouridine(1915)-N(3))-methyltransferase RlmH [Victivallaceae bacterium]
MLIKIVAVGKIKDRSLQSKIAEFTKWLSPFAKLETSEIRDSDTEKEGAAILKAIDKDKAFVFVLSEEGGELSSEEFSRKLSGIDRKIVFVIGGPFGLSEAVKKRADFLFSLSKMTFTHEMARLFLLEQIYRAIDISRSGKYHNA